MNENKTVFYEDDKTYSGGGTSNYILPWLW